MADMSILALVRWRSVLFSLIVILGQVVCGGYNTFNLTMVAVKERFNYTQTEVELIVSAVTLGFGTGMPSGIILDKYGPKWTSVIGLITTVPGFGFLYLATMETEFFRDKAWLFALLTFLTGQGFFVTFSISWTTGARTADPRIRGVVFGVLKSCVLGSPVLFTLLYERFFKKEASGSGAPPDLGGGGGASDDIGGYMLFLLICVSSLDIITLIFLRDRTLPFHTNDNTVEENVSNLPQNDCTSGTEDREKRYDKTSPDSNKGDVSNDVEHLQLVEERISSDEETPLVHDRLSIQDHVPLSGLLRNPVFHCITWSVALGLTSDTVVYGNIAVISQSLQLQAHNTALMILNRVLICCATLCSGVFLNFVCSHFARCLAFTVAMTIVLISNILLAATAESIVSLSLGLVLEGFGSGMIWVFGAAITFSFCGARDYGRNWGTVIMAVFLISLCVSLILGRMYDFKVTEVSNTCIGDYCTADWFYVLSGLSLASMVLSGALTCMVYRGTVPNSQ